MLDNILNFLLNPWILLMIISPLLFLFGIIGGNLLSQPRKNRVLKVSPESHRGVELEIKSEDAINVYCPPVGNMPPQRFIKRLSAFNIIRKGWLRLQNYALWIGRYGTAYVHKFDNEPVELSFKEAVYNVLGEKYYKQIPDPEKNHIEDGSIGVMIDFPKLPLTPTDKDGKALPSISEDDLKRDSDERAMANLWDTFDKERKRSYLNMIAFIGTGIGIGVVLSLLFKWGSPVVIPPVIPSTPPVV